jgi:hypothetical protein
MPAHIYAIEANVMTVEIGGKFVVTPYMLAMPMY